MAQNFKITKVIQNKTLHTEISYCRVELEVDQRMGSTYLLEAGRATGATNL